MTTTTMEGTSQGASPLGRGIGPVGKIAVSWAAAGGVLTGGFLVAAMTLAGKLSGHALLLTCSGLFVVGAGLGFAHGAVLGWMGRPEGVNRRAALGQLGLAAVYAVPALLVSWLLAGWIGMTSVALYTGKMAPLIGCGVAWLVGIGMVVLGIEQGWTGIRGAYASWSNARAGTLIVAALFGGLLALFLAERPELWGVHLRVTPVGAVLLAVTATLWLAGPLVTVSLILLERLPVQAPSVAFGGTRSAAVSIAVAVLVGVGMALIALPFYQGAYVLPASSLSGVLTTALLDEVLLRLFLVTAVTWLLLRELHMSGGRAAALAVGVGALAQVLIYLPGVMAIGFPSASMTAGFVLATVAVPALAFGFLFWRRGFGSALVAHATALAALLIIG